MIDPRTNKLAHLLVNYSVKVKKGDWVLVRGDISGLPLVNEVVREVLRAGGHPQLMMGSADLAEITLKESSDEQLEFVSPIEKMIFNEVDAMISVRSTDNTRSLNNIDPSRARKQGLARKDLMAAYMQRSADGDLRWTVALHPCPAYAQEADMSLDEYANFVYSATMVDHEDPVAEWQKVHDEQEKMCEWLKGKKDVIVKGPNADITLSIDGRVFVNADGTKNMPSGEIFTGPVEDSVNGWIQFSYPALVGGREVEGIKLKFENGKVTEASAKKNEEFLFSQLDSDDGARYLGEFAIGTNYGIQKFTKNILFDEKIGGTLHMAVGAGYPETGSKNKSSIHWDMICDMRTDSEIRVDGELFYQNGQFMVD